MREIIGIACGVVALLSLGIAIGMIVSQCWYLGTNKRLRQACREELDRLHDMKVATMDGPTEPKEPELDVFPKS